MTPPGSLHNSFQDSPSHLLKNVPKAPSPGHDVPCQGGRRRRPQRIGQASPKNFADFPRGLLNNLPRVGMVCPKTMQRFLGNLQGDARVYPKDFPVIFRGIPGKSPGNPQ